MADVTGDLGGQPIELNNAATETTLKQLLAAMIAMVDASSSGKKGAKLQKELEEELKRLAKASKSATDALTDEEKERKKKQAELKKQADEEKKAAAELVGSLNNLYKGVENVALGMVNLLSTMSDVGNSMSSAASAMSAIPVVGGLVSRAFGAVAGAAEKTYKSFQQAASVGANFGGSMTDMVNSASGAGLTFDQFSGIIAKNGEAIALLGGGANNGAKRLAELGKSIRNTDLGNQLGSLGYSTEQINEGFLRYSAMQAKSGNVQKLSNDELIKQTGDYLKNLDAVSKLTGKAKETMQAEEDARQRDAQYRVAERKIAADDRKNLSMFMNSLTEAEQEAFKEMLATGALYGDASQKLSAVSNDTAQALLDTALKARASGKFSEQTAFETDKRLNAVAKSAQAQADAQQFGAYMADQYGKQTLSLMDRQSRSTDLETERRKTEAKTTEDTAQKLKTFKEQIAQVGNQFTIALVNSGLIDKLIPAFKTLAEFTAGFVLPAFTFVAEHASFFGVLLGGVAVTLTALNTIIGINAALEKAKQAQVILATTGLGRMVGALMANLAAYWPVIAAIAALTVAWKVLTNYGWDLGTVFEAIGDNIKRFAINYVDIWLSIAEKVAKFFGGGDKITAMRQRLDVERQELDEREKARDQRRKQNVEEQKAKNGEISTTKSLTDAKNEELKKTQASTDATVDWGDTVSVLRNEINQRRGQPGATAAQPGGIAAPAGPMTMPSAAPADIQKYLQATALVESGGNPLAKAGTSSAGGMFQFVDATWKQMVKEMGKDYSLQDKFDPKKSAEVMAYFTQKQKGQLEKGIGRQASNTDLYMSHFLGAGGATKFLNAMQKDPSQSAAMLDPAAAKANKSIYYTKEGKERSLQEVYSLMGSKIGKAEQAVASGKWGGKAISAEVLALGGTTGVPSAPQTQGTLAAATPTGRPATPASVNLASADSLRLSMEKEAELRRQAAEKQKPGAIDQAKEVLKKDLMGTAYKPPAAQPIQETAETLLASLNTKMDQLIQISSRLGDVNERQLSVQRGLGKDAYAI